MVRPLLTDFQKPIKPGVGNYANLFTELALKERKLSLNYHEMVTR